MLSVSGPIGIFDSGIGGLSVLRHIRQQLPCEDLVYYADSGHAPYGEKPEQFVVERSFRIARFLIDMGIKALVIACNTATATSIHLLREKYPALPIIGVEPGLKPGATLTHTGTVGVMATERTLSSNKFHLLEDTLSHSTGVHFVVQPCHGLADMIEHANLDSDQIVDLVRSYLVPLLEKNADTIVLGCTHYPFIRHIIEHVARESCAILPNIIDTGNAIARQLKSRLDALGLIRSQNQNLASTAVFTSGDPEAISRLITRLLQTELPVSYISLDTSVPNEGT